MTIQTIKKEFFSTWQEASEVCVKAEVKSWEDYRNRYKQINSKLPSNPERHYSDWPGWVIFLDKYFSTWQEASKVCIKAGVKGYIDYCNRYEQINSKLPSSAWSYYKNWPGWKTFLNKCFFTWQKASAICIKVGVKSKTDYVNRYKQISSKLPSSPWSYYKDWPGWYVFLGKK